MSARAAGGITRGAWSALAGTETATVPSHTTRGSVFTDRRITRALARWRRGSRAGAERRGVFLQRRLDDFLEPKGGFLHGIRVAPGGDVQRPRPGQPELDGDVRT